MSGYPTDNIDRFKDRAVALREAIERVNEAQRNDNDNRHVYFDEKYAILDSFRVMSGIPLKCRYCNKRTTT